MTFTKNQVMQPKPHREFGWMASSLVSIFLLCSCSSDRRMGRDAAAAMGLQGYVLFQREHQPDSAALFYWRGNWRLYHPSMGSCKIPSTDLDSPPIASVLCIKDASGPIHWVRIHDTDSTNAMTNGCLPRAIRECRLHGGGIAEEPNHARYYVP